MTKWVEEARQEERRGREREREIDESRSERRDDARDATAVMAERGEYRWRASSGAHVFNSRI